MDFMEFDDFFAKSVLHQKVEKKQDVWDRFDCETAKQDFITSGGTLIHLIESFTESAANYLLEVLKPVDILILCGPNYNGAEGFALARVLAKYEFPVTVAMDTLMDHGKSPEYLAERTAWHGTIYDFMDVNYDHFQVVIDCLYGSELTEPLQRKDISVIKRINESRCQVIAIDVPSGLDCDSGEALGAVIQAKMTITAGAPKQGFFAGEGLVTTGKLIIKSVS